MRNTSFNPHTLGIVVAAIVRERNSKSESAPYLKTTGLEIPQKPLTDTQPPYSARAGVTVCAQPPQVDANLLS